MLAQIVAAPRLEFLEERRRPIRLPGRIVDLVGVVEERAEAQQLTAGERPIERREVASDRGA